MKLNKILNIWILVFLCFSVVFGATFEWNPEPPVIINITQNEVFYYDVNVSVDESLINFGHYKDVQDPDINGTVKNTNTGEIIMHPSNEDVLNYYGTYLAMDFKATNISDPMDVLTHNVFFRILNVNDAPIINTTSPNYNVGIAELESQTFTSIFYDIDPTNDNITVNWYLDGVLNETNLFDSMTNNIEDSDSWTYIAGYESSGIHTVKVEIIDDFGASDSYSWNLIVSNENRYPEIDWYSPNSSFVEINETDNIFFEVNVSDPDVEDDLDVLWYLDGIIEHSHFNTEISSWTYNSDYSSAGIHNVTVVVTDGNFTREHFWNVSVLNVNLAPNITYFNTSSEFVQETTSVNLSFEAFDFDENLDKYELRRNGTLVDSGNINNYNDIGFEWIPNFGESGVYNFTLFVNDTEGLSDNESLIINVIQNVAPLITDYVNITSTYENETLYLNFTATDNNSNIDTSIILVDDVIIDYSNSTSLYFNFSTSGIHNITYFVNDTEGLYDYIQFDFEVINVNLVPEISNIEYNSSINEGENLTINFDYYDFDNNTDFVGIYKNGTLVSSTNSLVWSTSFFDAGTYNFTLFVNDTDGAFAISSFLATVVDNEAPIIENFSNYSIEGEGEILNFNFSYTDINNNVNFVGIYLNGTLLNSSNETSYYFDEVSSGYYNITYFVSDAQGLFDTQTIIFFINETNFPPEINISSIYTNSPINEGEDLIISFNATDVDLNIDEYAIYYEGSKVSSTNFYNWSTDFYQSGDHTFVLFVNDTKGLNDTENITVHVINNVAPEIITYINVSTGIEKSNILFGFNANDSNNNLADFGIYKDSVFISGNTSQIYFDENSEGLHNITYFVNDTQGLFDIVTIWINISNVNEPPVISNIEYNSSINEGENLTISFDATDIDNNIDEFRIYRNGTLVSSTNSLIWNTSFFDAGIYNFTLYVNDTFNENDTSSFLVTIIDNVPPTITNYTNLTNVYEGNIYYFNFNATDVNNNLLNYSIFLDNNLLNLTNLSSYYFNFTSTGYHNITYFVNDTQGLNDTLIVSIFVNDVNALPQINFSSISSYEIVEDNSSIIYLDNYVYDEDDLDNFLSWNCSIIGNNSNVNLNLNNSDRTLLISPFGSFYGIKNISCIVYDSALANDTSSFILNVINGDNDAPVIINYTPTNLSLVANETQTLNFSINAYDIEKQNLNYYWYLDFDLVNSSQNASIYLDYFTAGIRNITVVIEDEDGATTNLSWSVNVSNVNRQSFYGKETKLFDLASFSSGNFSNVTYVNNSLVLDLNGSEYFLNGTYISPVISKSLIDFIFSFNWSTENFNKSNLNLTNINLYYRSGSTISVGTGWSDWILINSSNFNETYDLKGSNFQYKIFMQTFNTNISPEVSNLAVKYLVGNKEFNKDTSILNWIDLDDYFYDLDIDDTLIFFTSNVSNINFTINSQNYLSIIPKAGFYGTVVAEVLVNDGYLNTSSGNITFTVNNVVNTDTSTSTSSSGGGGGGTKKKTVYVEKEKVVPKDSIELNLPKPIKSDNDTILVPIKIKNIYNYSLENISLKLGSSNSSASLSFYNLMIDSLEAGEEYEVQVEVSNISGIKDFYLNVTALQDYYGFRDTGVIYLESMKDNTSAYEKINTKIEYAQELITDNPDCLELKEHILQAKVLLENGKNDDALQLIEKTISSCKTLLNSDNEFSYADLVSDDKIQREEFKYYFMNSLYILLVLLIYPVIIAIKSYLRKHVHKKSKIHDDLNDYLSKLDDKE